MLKTFTDRDKSTYGNVMELADCDVADTFPAFAEQLKADGFAFLYQRVQAGIPTDRFWSRSRIGASSEPSAPWGSCSTPPGGQRSLHSTSLYIPTIGTAVTAGHCGERQWRGELGTGPSTRSSKPLPGAQLNCSTCPKACPPSGSYAVRTTDVR